MEDKLEITIRIADLPPMGMSIKRADEEVVRTAEYNINQLWRKWTSAYRNLTSQQVLGMVAFQFAKLCELLDRKNQATNELLSNFEDGLDRILLNMEDGQNPGYPEEGKLF